LNQLHAFFLFHLFVITLAYSEGMDTLNTTNSLLGLGALSLVYLMPKIKQRLELSRAKHRSLAGHSKMSKRIARMLPFYEYDEQRFFDSDGASAQVAQQRRAAFYELAWQLTCASPKSIAATSSAEAGISDLQFTSRYRVPFQYSQFVKKHLKSGSFLSSSGGVFLKDLDDQVFYDLTGSYGVNVLGNDFYKHCMQAAHDAAKDLGPVLGSYHPSVSRNVERLKRISGLDEVSFHMSGTEAVMQAVRLARYHSRKRYLVRFCGAYHGWWGDVQPGIGNPSTAYDTFTLAEMSEATLRVLATRKDIACVLVNPLQALHPNQNAPGDSALADSSRRANFDREAYGQWLKKLRAVCDKQGIALIFDEVFVGFRLASGGAQEYFGVQADLVTYGKTLGGGFPVGVLCGASRWMRRFDPQRPVDVCFARGTFNAHPYVMAAMDEFLSQLETENIAAIYSGLDERWNQRASQFNARMESEGLPVRVANLSSIWTVLYTEPSRYNWMFQYYLKAQGLALSWVGTGRVVFSLNYTQTDFEVVLERFVLAAKKMEQAGWWSAVSENNKQLTNKGIKRSILKEMLRVRFSALSYRVRGRSIAPSASTAESSSTV
jgi:glutamate-1-semialdehyde 2,1-aminomutase